VLVQICDNGGPVSKVHHAGEEKVSGPGEEAAGHEEDEEVTRGRAVTLGFQQQHPEDQGEDEIDDGTGGGDRAGRYVALEGDGAHRDLLRSAKPRDDAVTESLVKDGLYDVGQTGEGDDGEAIVA